MSSSVRSTCSGKRLPLDLVGSEQAEGIGQQVCPTRWNVHTAPAGCNDAGGFGIRVSCYYHRSTSPKVRREFRRYDRVTDSWSESDDAGECVLEHSLVSTLLNQSEPNEPIARQIDRGNRLSGRIVRLDRYRNHRLRLGIDIFLALQPASSPASASAESRTRIAASVRELPEGVQARETVADIG